MTITRSPDSEPRKPVRGTLADVATEGGDERETSEMRRDPEARQQAGQQPEELPDLERIEDIKR